MSVKKQRKAQAAAAAAAEVTTATSGEQGTDKVCDVDRAEEDAKPRERQLSKSSAQQAAAQGAASQARESGDPERDAEAQPFRAPLVWTNIILFVLLHSALPIGAVMLYNRRPWLTLLWMLVGIYISVLGVTAGTHRLWSHKSYKAKWPVQVLLMILQTMAGQNSIYTWSRDHRVHHKFAETNADPHNILRGFFFAHMGWLCCRKHPDVKEKGALVDMSDLEANPVVMFQHRNFWWLSFLFTMLVPTLVPMWLWSETFWMSFVIGFMWRYIISLHGTWLVNSAAHYHGTRPYDERMEARESPVVIWTGVGEGFHNYHHTFPFDYSTSEYGVYYNITTAFIDLCAALGLAYDLRKMDAKTIDARRARTGDQRDIIRQASLLAGGNEPKCAGQEQHDEREEDNADIELVSKTGCSAKGEEQSSGSLRASADLTAMKFSL